MSLSILHRRRKLQVTYTTYPTASLLHYYKAEDTSGDVLDAHGTNDLTNFTVTRGAQGKVNLGYDTGYLKIPVSNMKSLSCWVKINELPFYLVDFRTDRTLYLASSTTTPAGFDKMMVNAVETEISAHQIPEDVWAHVYLELSTAFTGTLTFGSRYNGAEVLQGLSDEISIHSANLSQSDVDTIYNNGNGTTL